jgi:hypothetical protein
VARGHPAPVSEREARQRRPRCQVARPRTRWVLGVGVFAHRGVLRTRWVRGLGSSHTVGFFAHRGCAGLGSSHTVGTRGLGLRTLWVRGVGSSHTVGAWGWVFAHRWVLRRPYTGCKDTHSMRSALWGVGRCARTPEVCEVGPGVVRKVCEDAGGMRSGSWRRAQGMRGRPEVCEVGPRVVRKVCEDAGGMRSGSWRRPQGMRRHGTGPAGESSVTTPTAGADGSPPSVPGTGRLRAVQ